MKNSTFLRNTATILALMSAISLATPPKRADAILSAFTGGAGMLIAGIILASGSVIPYAVGVTSMVRANRVWMQCHEGPRHRRCPRGRQRRTVFREATAVGSAFGGPVLGLGILLLDQSDGAPLEFTSLTEAQRTRLGIEESEYEVYELELEQIAAAIETASALAIEAGVTTPEQAQVFYEQEYRASLSPDSLMVMAKITHPRNDE